MANQTAGAMLIDLTGQTLGHWLVIAKGKDFSKKSKWACRCLRCDHEQQVNSIVLRTSAARCSGCGATKSGTGTKYPPKPAPLKASVAPVAQPPVARCSVCQYLAAFERGRCTMCGTARSYTGVR